MSLDLAAARPRNTLRTGYKDFIAIVTCLTNIARQLEEAEAELTYESWTDAVAAPDDE